MEGAIGAKKSVYRSVAATVP